LGEIRKRPLVSVDIAIFAVRGDVLRVLLVRRGQAPEEPFPGRWALPGGFIDVERDADLEACAARKLADKTGASAPYLEQVGSWGSATRDPRGWSATHVYFSLVPEDEVALAAKGDTAWHEVGEALALPLAFDHAVLLAAAVERLRAKVEYTSLPAFLLPREFTLTELQRAYEVVLGRALDKSAFRTRILAAELVVEVPRWREGANRPAQLYRLRSRRAPHFFQRTFKPAG
jgi:ADP-ribose pyrophosphatase YjhB (NUDIX family)